MPVLNDRDIHQSSKGVAPVLQNLICINFRDARGMQGRGTQDTDWQQLKSPRPSWEMHPGREHPPVKPLGD